MTGEQQCHHCSIFFNSSLLRSTFAIQLQCPVESHCIPKSSFTDHISSLPSEKSCIQFHVLLHVSRVARSHRPHDNICLRSHCNTVLTTLVVTNDNEYPSKQSHGENIMQQNKAEEGKKKYIMSGGGLLYNIGKTCNMRHWC